MEKVNLFFLERVDVFGKNLENIKILCFEFFFMESDEKKCLEFLFLDFVKVVMVGNILVYEVFF